MKTPLHSTTNRHRELGRSAHWRPYARYPSSYGDFEPFFKRGRSTRRSTAADSNRAGTAWMGTRRSRIAYVRVFALLALIVIIAVLAARS